ncbi:MAG: tetratricopeptide repeat protein [Bacteroidota bacterium]
MKLLLNIWLFALSSLLLFSPALAQDDMVDLKDARYYMERGLEAYYQKDYGNAIRNFDMVLRLNPRFPDVYQFRGNAFFLVGDYARAEYDYIIAIDRFRIGAATVTRPTHDADNLTIIDPGRNVAHQANLAALYNNRGAARSRLGRKAEALADFDKAQELDPGLLIAQQNGEFVYSGKPGSKLQISDARYGDRGDMDTGKYRYGAGNTYRDHRYERPVVQSKTVDTKRFRQESKDLREARMRQVDESEGGASESFFDKIFKPKPFVKRKVRGGKKVYRRPKVQKTTQDYLRIEQVEITNAATYVTVAINNTRTRDFRVSLDPVGSSGAFYLTDRTGQDMTRYELRGVEGLPFHPRVEEIAKGEEHFFILEFDRIDDFVGTIHMIEGNKQTDSAWNFYHISLPE